MSRGNTIPKHPNSRQRRNAAVPLTVLGPPPKDPPPLPRRSRLRAETLAWYQAWASSPQASQFTSTDWTRLHMVALLVDRFYRSPDKGLLGEIRLSERELGGTVESRLRLRWTLPQQEEDTQPAPKKPRKQRRDPRLALVN